MDKLEEYRQTIKRVLAEYASYPYSNSTAKKATVFDPVSDRYLLIAYGRETDGRRAHACIAHVEIVDGKIWIQCDGTEYGIANELLDAGVPKDKIVLGFKSPELRRYTEFAAA